MAQESSTLEGHPPDQLAADLLTTFTKPPPPQGLRQVVVSSLATLPDPDLLAPVINRLDNLSRDRGIPLPDEVTAILRQVWGYDETEDPAILSLREVYNKSYANWQYYENFREYKKAVDDGRRIQNDWLTIQPSGEVLDPNQLATIGQQLLAVRATLKSEEALQRNIEAKINRESTRLPLNQWESDNPRIQGLRQLQEHSERFQREIGNEDPERLAALRLLEKNIDALLLVHPNSIAKALRGYVLSDEEKAQIDGLKTRIADAQQVIAVIDTTVSYKDPTFRAWSDRTKDKKPYYIQNLLPNLPSDASNIRKALYPEIPTHLVIDFLRHFNDMDRINAFERLIKNLALVIIFGDRMPEAAGNSMA